MQFRGSAGAYARPYHLMSVAAKIGEAKKNGYISARWLFASFILYGKIIVEKRGEENFMINFDEKNEVITEYECRAILVGIEAGA